MSGTSGFATTLDGRTHLHWQTTGDGEPVLLIMGLGLSGGAWWRTVPVLAQRLRVITFDNRGVGSSRAFSYAYTTAAMADDAATVLDAVGVERAHVYGISLGGMVAQVLALRHPERVRSLVLGATSPGGPRAARPTAEVTAFFRRRPRMAAEDAAWESVPINYGPRCRAEHFERIEEDVAQRLAHPFSERAYRAQLFAAAWHNCLGALSRITVPTLVVHGALDRVVPAANAHLMAERIPGARLRILEGVGHLYPTEEPSADREIARFLADQREEAA
jgi:3-oxoadipate enol-lactonase